MSRRRLIGVFNEFPKELFQVNNGLSVSLRIWRPGAHYYDVIPEDGLIPPKALRPNYYSG